MALLRTGTVTFFLFVSIEGSAVTSKPVEGLVPSDFSRPNSLTVLPGNLLFPLVTSVGLERYKA